MPSDPPASHPAFLVARHDGCELSVRVIPRAGRSGVAGERAGALLVRLAAAPIEGAANDALVALLARTLGVGRRAITLLAGERARDKRLFIAGLTVEAAARRLEASEGG